MVTRHDMSSEYNRFACEDQVVIKEDPEGQFVKFEDYAALAAQVKALRNIKRYSEGTTTVSDGYERWPVSVLNEDKNGKIIKAEEFDAILAVTPEHHLLELLAEAGRTGYMACANDLYVLASQWYSILNLKANQCADNIRQKVNNEKA